MSDEERLKIIIALRAKNMGWRKIGERVGLTGNGAMQAHRRGVEPGRYYKRAVEEVDPTAVQDEEW